MIFDDSFEHAAWNRSDAQLVILPMDWWNSCCRHPSAL